MTEEEFEANQREVLAAAQAVVQLLETAFGLNPHPHYWDPRVGEAEGKLAITLMVAHGWEAEGFAAIRLAQKRHAGETW